MGQSAVDIGNPIYEKSDQVQFHREIIADQFEDDEGKEFDLLGYYEYFTFNGETHIVEYDYQPIGSYMMTDESLEESVREHIHLHEGGCVFECKRKELTWNPKIRQL